MSGRGRRTGVFGRNVVYREKVDSTNTLAMELAAGGAPHGTVVTADMQTGGRGRLGRHWISPSGCNLYMSLVLIPPVSPGEACQIPVLSVIASMRALERLAPTLPLRVKWPNDIYCGGRKLSGTLCEMKAEIDRVSYAVVGIGINLNSDRPAGGLPETATSLLMETGVRYSRTMVAALVLDRLEDVYEEWLEEGDLGSLREEWNSRSLLMGRVVDIRSHVRIITGKAAGIDKRGALQLEMSDGSLRSVHAGEVNLLGVPSSASPRT